MRERSVDWSGGPKAAFLLVRIQRFFGRGVAPEEIMRRLGCRPSALRIAAALPTLGTPAHWAEAETQITAAQRATLKL